MLLLCSFFRFVRPFVELVGSLWLHVAAGLLVPEALIGSGGGWVQHSPPRGPTGLWGLPSHSDLSGYWPPKIRGWVLLVLESLERKWFCYLLLMMCLCNIKVYKKRVIRIGMGCPKSQWPKSWRGGVMGEWNHRDFIGWEIITCKCCSRGLLCPGLIRRGIFWGSGLVCL